MMVRSVKKKNKTEKEDREYYKGITILERMTREGLSVKVTWSGDWKEMRKEIVTVQAGALLTWRNSRCKGPAAGARLVQTTTRGSSGWSRVNGESREWNIKEVMGLHSVWLWKNFGAS